MIALKQLIKYDNANAIEATWVDIQPLPDLVIPEVPGTPALYDAEGNEVQAAVEAIPERTETGRTEETVIHCQAYDQYQMDLLRADAAKYGTQFDQQQEALIEEVIANQEPIPPVPVEVFINEVVGATQSRLDAFSKTRNYDGILSACTYATSSVPKSQTEGQYCVNARDATWAALYTIFDEVQAGQRPMPGSVEDVMALLPPLEWPEPSST